MLKTNFIIKTLIILIFFLSIMTPANSTADIIERGPLRLSTQKNQPLTTFKVNTNSQLPQLVTDNRSGSWQELGPEPLNNPNNIDSWGSSPFSGRVTSIAINNSNPEEIYLGAAQGGVWKTLNGGSSWSPLMDQQNSLAVGSIAISPDSHTVYVGTGEANQAIDSYSGIGLLKSTDEGKTWTLLGANYFNGSSISSIAIRTNNPNNILVATTNGAYAKGLGWGDNPNGVGVYLSTDGGLTWSRTLSQLSTASNGVAELVVNASNDNIIYAGDWGGYIWRSIDGGSTWGAFLHESTTLYQGRVAIAMTPANPSYLYYVFVGQSGEIASMGVYYASAAHSFNSLPNPTSNQYGPCNGQCWYDILIKVDPSNVNHILIGTNSLYNTTNGGSSWTLLGGADLNGNLHPDMHAFAFEPGNSSVFYSGNDGGIYKTTDNGATWTSLNTNLGTIQFVSIAASPTNDAHLIGGVQDNACDIYTNNTSWTLAAGGDGAASLFFSDTQMACNYVLLDPRISYDNGNTFIDTTNGINTNDPSLFYAPMIQDPSNPYTLYLGSNRIYKLTQGSSTWNDISGQISTGEITTIAVAKTNSNIIVEGDTKGLIKVSTTSGSTWNMVFNASIPITSIAIDPFNSSIIYASTTNQTVPKMYVTLNQGASWYYYYLTGMANVAINVIKVNPITDTVFIGTDRGLYFFNSTGVWPLGSGLPNAAIYDLAFTSSNYLVVGTHGRGAWLNYMTPIVETDVADGSSLQSGSSITVSITDSNGFTDTSYHWDQDSNSTGSSSFNTYVPAGEGQHSLFVYAKDVAGNWITKQYVFNADNTPPVVTLKSLTNNTNIQTQSSIEVTFTDVNSIQSVQYSWNDGSNNTVTVTNNSAAILAPGTVGQATLIIYAEDSVGNIGITMFVFQLTEPIIQSSSSSTTPISTITTTPTIPTKTNSNSNTGPGLSTNSSKLPSFELAISLLAIATVLVEKRRNHKNK